MAAVRRQFDKAAILALHKEVLEVYRELDPPAEIAANVYQSVVTMAGQHEVTGLGLGLPAMAIPGNKGH